MSLLYKTFGALLEQLVFVYCTDRDGTVDFKEFLCGLALLQGPSEEGLKSEFYIGLGFNSIIFIEITMFVH